MVLHIDKATGLGVRTATCPSQGHYYTLLYYDTTGIERLSSAGQKCTDSNFKSPKYYAYNAPDPFLGSGYSAPPIPQPTPILKPRHRIQHHQIVNPRYL